MAAPEPAAGKWSLRGSGSFPSFRSILACGAILLVLTLIWFNVDGIYVSSSAAMLRIKENGIQEDPGARPEFMPLRLVTFNIRYATSQPFFGERTWDIRRPKVCSQLRFITAGHASPFLCLQESLYPQVKDIHAGLGASWSYIGRGRDDGETGGEFSPIFYRSDLWSCVRNETRWLSTTPDRPSLGWDAICYRIVTIGEFTHKIYGTTVVVMSTHLDNEGVQARVHSAELLIETVREWSQGTAAPLSAVLMGGDFNSPIDDAAYKIMTAPGSGLSDLVDLVPEDRRYGNNLTYTSFGGTGEAPDRIDFLFIQEPRTAQIQSFGVLANRFDDQIFLSDHRAVVADIDIVV